MDKFDTLNNCFEKQVALNPNEVAIISKDRLVTFKELLVLVNQMGHYLQSHGLKPGDRVVVMMKRDENLIAMLIACLTLGVAYIPLDSKTPEQRIHQIVSDSESLILLTNLSVPRTVFDIIKVADVNQDQVQLHPVADLPANTDLNKTAYILYTSGSTGKPKGVMINHLNIASMLSWAAQTFSIEQRRGVLASTSVAFDLSVFEIFLPLLYGGTVVLVENILQLSELPEETNITLINTVPSAINEALNLGIIPSSVRTINLAGEPFTQKLANQLYEKTSVEYVYNLYGPSETTTYSSCYLVPRHSEEGFVPIGTEITGDRIFILNERMQLVPPMMLGEIYIAGLGVSQGYLNREELNKSFFIKHSFDGVNTIKLYKTGDLAKRRLDGEIEFHGRKDHQIKLRGFRVELGEIESQINKHPKVLQAIVNAYGENQNKYLVAYFLSDSEIESEELMNFLHDTLPKYAIPAHFVRMKKFPLNSNGKIDRMKLPTLEKINNKVSKVTQPRTELEKRILTIWQSLLPHSEIDIHSNFFKLGGHSLLATQLVSRINSEIDENITLMDVFLKPTVKEQAQLCESSHSTAKKDVLPEIPVNFEDKKYPLSSAQKRMWLLEHMEPGLPISNIPILLNIQGSFNVDAFIQSINQIIRCHPILRTVYESEEGVPKQKIISERKIVIPTVNVADYSEQEINELIIEEANKAFDIAKDLMLRVLILKKSDSEHKVLLTQHHLASDAWSLNILTQELGEYYSAYVGGTSIVGKESGYPYALFSDWQNNFLKSKKIEHQLTYWKEKLRDSIHTLPLPTDKPRSKKRTYEGAFHRFSVENKLLDRIKEFCNQHDVTLFMFLLTSFKLLLLRYSGQKDINVGTLIANRNRSKIENTLGFFTNTQVLRTQFDDKWSALDLLMEVKNNALGAFENQDVPFDVLVEHLNIDRSSNLNPLFQVLFTLQNTFNDNLNFPDCQVEVSDIDRKISKFDLTLNFSEINGDLQGLFEYSTDLFVEKTIEDIAKNYITLVENIIQNPTGNIYTIPLVSNDEYTRLSGLDHKPDPKFPANSNIISFFEEQVELTPDLTAIVEQNKEISYSALNKKANRLARLLQEKNIKKGDNVGIFLARSIDYIVCMIAILKIGACYVPLDMDYPESRNQFILEDSKTKMVLSNTSSVAGLDSILVKKILLDKLKNDLSNFSDANLTNDSKISDTAYLMYTSGSTGIPKGVRAPHSGVIRLVKNTNYTSIDSNDVLLQISPLVFDGATFDIWGALLNGAKLVLLENGIPELRKLASLIDECSVTISFMTTQLFNSLVERHIDKLVQLKKLYFGGERTSPEFVQKFLDHNKSCSLYNVYGPTETTTFATFYPITNLNSDSSVVPIGKAISNTEVYLVDDKLQLVPRRVSGEILIGGLGLANGYLNQPELTQEKFIDNPFGEGKLYRTGDIGRYNHDYDIEFVGRVDTQIKLSGYRIELEEIASVAEQHPDVSNSLILHETDPDPHLVAYLVTENELDKQIYMKYLSERLPHYMMPRHVIFLDEFPTNSNGKIDKVRLPKASVDTRLVSNRSDKNDLESILCDAWCEVLESNNVGLSDNFFDIGGNSLKLIHLVDIIQTQFLENDIDYEIEVMDFFEYPTIASFKEYLIGGVEVC